MDTIATVKAGGLFFYDLLSQPVDCEWRQNELFCRGRFVVVLFFSIERERTHNNSVRELQ